MKIGGKSLVFSAAPPTYEETMGAVDINDLEEDAHPIGSKPYAPRYPVYHRTSQNFADANGGPSAGRSNMGFRPDL